MSETEKDAEIARLKQLLEEAMSPPPWVEEARKAVKGSSTPNGKTPVLFRFKPEFLERIDAAAKKHELPRQAWVRTIIARELEAEGY